VNCFAEDKLRRTATFMLRLKIHIPEQFVLINGNVGFKKE